MKQNADQLLLEVMYMHKENKVLGLVNAQCVKALVGMSIDLSLTPGIIMEVAGENQFLNTVL